MSDCVSPEFRRSLSLSMQEITRRFAGIELTEGAPSLAPDVCTVHAALEGECRADLLLCADTALFTRLARSIIGCETVTGQDIEDVATEYFNVICGHVTALLFQTAHLSSRFQIPRFHTGCPAPRFDCDRRWAIGYNSPHNESLYLVCVAPPKEKGPTPS